MPSPPPGKHRPPVIRQLSLQNQPSLQPPSSRGLKKQLSEDDGRVLEAVGVTRQGWSAELRIGPGGGKGVGQTRVTGTRPKPVKVAWADKKPECPAGVEVIATKCQGQPRPASVKNQRLRSPLLGSKDTLVYTRLQLAERLRNAWSEREKIKPNINIFLARAPDTTRSENNEAAADRTVAETPFQDAASAFSDSSAPLDKKRKSMKVRAFSQDFPHFGQEDFTGSEPEATSEESRSDVQSKSSSEGGEKEGRRLQELSKIEIRMTKIEGGGGGIENKCPESESGGSSAGVKRCRDKTCEPAAEGRPEEGKDATAPPPASAQDRRANFRRSSVLQKTITESFSSSLPEKNPEENAMKTVVKPIQKKPPLVRAFSAPSQSDQASDINKAADLEKKVRMIPQRRLQPSVSFDLSCTNTDDSTAFRDRVKSAPVKRRLKSAAARRKNKDKDSSDEDKEPKESTKKTTRRHQLKKGADIVTMVSLVSPAASDTEDSVITLPIDSWTPQHKNEPPNTTKPPSANAQQQRDPPSALQQFVSLRKTTKSVTFQPHPVLGRGYSASFPSRRAPAGTPIIVPTPVVTNPALTPAQLLEREKRAAVFSGIAADGRGVKRRLLRSSTEFPNNDYNADEKPCEASKTDTGFPDTAGTRKDDADGAEDKTNQEPDFKCPRERECWNLYQKMLEKGVSVSFDTVLRGMLTPTEYRLRKNQLLSSC